MNWSLSRNHQESPSGEVVGSNIHEALRSIGCSLEMGGTTGPGRWLARGKESSRVDEILYPQPGQFASWGVFFADNYEGLVIPKNGYIYI